MKKNSTIPDFQAKFGVSIPLHVQRVWMETTIVKRRWWFDRYEQIARKGDVLKATRVEVSPSVEGGEFIIRVVYQKAPGTRSLVTPIRDGFTLHPVPSSPQEEQTIRFSDRVIREKLEAELGTLPPLRGNFVCSSCAIGTGDSDYCPSCGSHSYWTENGGGCRYSCEMVVEW